MEHVAFFPPRRRSREDTIDWDMCYICQEPNVPRSGKVDKPPHKATSDGLERFTDCANQRLKYHDLEFVETLDRFEALGVGEAPSKIIWHAKCYSKFTHKGHIERLKKRYEQEMPSAEAPSSSGNVRSGNVACARSSRRSSMPFDKDMCIFCQDEQAGAKLHDIQVLETSRKILSMAQWDTTMRIRLADINDLVAADAKYHLNCYAKFIKKYEKNVKQTENEPRPDEICFISTMDELSKGLVRGEIYSLCTVWDRYCELLSDFQCDPGIYRSNAFKKRIKQHLGDQVEFVKPLSQHESLLLFPAMTTELAAQAFLKASRDAAEEEEYSLKHAAIETADMDMEILSWMFRVALKVHADIKHTPGHKFIGGIDLTHAESVVPDSLYLLLRLLCSGDTLDEDDSKDNTNSECKAVHTKLLSIAQDIVFLVSRGHKQTPKHIGLGLAVHQATRSKDLVQLLNAAGHSISYESVMRIDTSIAQDVLQRYEDQGQVIIPLNFMHTALPGYLRYANDNIDINVESLDGKGSFHASQTAAFRRNTPDEEANQIHIKYTNMRSLKVPPEFHELQSVNIGSSKPEPVFPQAVNMSYYEPDKGETTEANLADLAWILCRQNVPEDMPYTARQVPAWTGFNQQISSVRPLPSTVGHLPIINAVAHDYDTIWTVMQNCQHMTKSLNQRYTVLTFDEQLYCKARMLKWHRPNECQNIVVMLGGFHIQMTFAKVIGKYMENSGLHDVWVESGVFGENTADNIMKGKLWNRVIRAHKLTFEALWAILWPALEQWAAETNRIIDSEIKHTATKLAKAFTNDDEKDIIEKANKELVSCLQNIPQLLTEFEEHNNEAPTFTFWRQYMELVGILLRFIRATREGNWKLYLSAFAEMLPWFSLFGHTHYTRWGSVFLADMRQLENTAPEVFQGVLQGDFVVKETEALFNQVPDDQALEHVNKVGKVAGGLIGITSTDSALERWSLTYNERASLAEDTKRMFDINTSVDDEDDLSHKDTGLSRMRRDVDDVRKLVAKFSEFRVFDFEQADMISISTRDVVPDDIKHDLESAQANGKKSLSEFVTARLIDKTKALHDGLPKNSPKTMASMYAVTVKTDKEKTATVKADRDLFRRIIIANEAGRDIDMDIILEQELYPVPLSLATTAGKLRVTNKSQLGCLLQEGESVSVNTLPASPLHTCTIIDAMALVQAIGKPAGAQTFGDLSYIFRMSINANFSNSARVDVVFDRYFAQSIKGGTRQTRAGKTRPIRRQIDSPNVKLPENWKNFIALDENKVNLSKFLCNELSDNPPDGDKEMVVGGGFDEIDKVTSSSGRDVTNLHATHEEADTRIILHAKDACNKGFQRTIVVCQDTDVLVLLTSCVKDLSKEVWMKTGKAKQPNYIAIHDIQLNDDIRNNLLAFHAISGCDTTSQFAGIGKKKAWKVFCENADLLHDIGVHQIPDARCIASAEAFVCKMYVPTTTEVSIHVLRCSMFRQPKMTIENLPPTKDALEQHIKRANYQTLIWHQSMVTNPQLPSPFASGWKLEDNALKPLLATKDPISVKCFKFAVCNCTETGYKCRTRQCNCRKNNLRCSQSCSCTEWCQNPNNED